MATLVSCCAISAASFFCVAPRQRVALDVLAGVCMFAPLLWKAGDDWLLLFAGHGRVGAIAQRLGRNCVVLLPFCWKFEVASRASARVLVPRFVRRLCMPASPALLSAFVAFALVFAQACLASWS